MTTTTERPGISAEIPPAPSDPPEGWETWALQELRQVRREGQRRAAERLSRRSVRTFPLAVRFREGGQTFVQRFSAPYYDPRAAWLFEESQQGG